LGYIIADLLGGKMYGYLKTKFKNLEKKFEDGVNLKAGIQSNIDIKNEVLPSVYKTCNFSN
jgi:hypothetical protein